MASSSAFNSWVLGSSLFKRLYTRENSGTPIPNDPTSVGGEVDKDEGETGAGDTVGAGSFVGDSGTSFDPPWGDGEMVGASAIKKEKISSMYE